MAYNTKEVKKDRDGNPISQYYNPTTDEYGIVEGSSGANKVILWDKNGNESEQLDLRPILSTLERLTGTVVDEETRKSNEGSRKSSESDRELAESTRQSQENTRQDNESQRELNESSRESAENIRETNELDRRNEEDIRKSNEATRQSNESDRKLAETSREDAENLRVSAETDRETEENIRKSNETTRISKESTREENENIRKSNELDREINESTRQSNESDRKSSEVIRESNESTRIDNMNIVEGWIANPERFNGRDIEYTWRGTELGIRLVGNTEYEYVDLKGETGDIENLTPSHIENALGFIPKDYKHPDKHPASIITETSAKKFVSDAEKAEWNKAKTDLDNHVESDFTNGPLHGWRLDDNNKPEYWNGIEWVRVKGDGYPVGNVSGFQAKGDNKAVELMWSDPQNVTVTDSNNNIITISRWKGTKILRKLGSYPVNENDGVLVVDNGIRDQYKTNGFIDTGLVNDRDYYYMAFPYTEEDVFTVDADNRVIGTPSDIDDKTNSPGPKNLQGGDMQAGYFGIVPATDLYTGDELANAVGITQGTSQFSNAGWLKFAIDGKIIYKSKKPFRNSISWDHINSKNCVFGEKTVVKDGTTYKVRLMKTGTEDPMSNYKGSDLFGSEWNRLMYPIHKNAKTDSGWYTDGNVEKPTPYWGVDFTNDDLGVVTIGGRYHWCQETQSSGRVNRGNNGVSNSNSNTSSNTGAYYGWSPVLEVVS